MIARSPFLGKNNWTIDFPIQKKRKCSTIRKTLDMRNEKINAVKEFNQVK